MAASVWGGSLHQTFRLISEPSANLRVFLNSDGASSSEVLARLPYESARAGAGGRGTPDSKRYRDGRHVYQTVGLLYEDDSSRVRLTELGKATRRWLGKLSFVNSPVLGRHAAYALAACQLRNPTRAGKSYATDVTVFPFTFIWQAMLTLDGRINSDELNRAIFRVTDINKLEAAVEQIARLRSGEATDPSVLGEETISGRAKNDRIIPWMALASFGWLLIADKRETGSEWYEVRPEARSLLFEATRVPRKHRDFTSTREYVEHISSAARLPEDVR